MKYLFTSESVSAGHPDKMADQVSDAILDAYLDQDSDSKVACECVLTKNRVIVAGEVSSSVNLQDSIPEIVREVISSIGYNSDSGFDPGSVKIKNLMHRQSKEIKDGVERGGAGDQGLMFGYACKETPEYMPYAISLAHRIMERHSEVRKSGKIPWLFPDAKSQVTVLYNSGELLSIDSIVVSTQHAPFWNGTRIHTSNLFHGHGHYEGLKAVSPRMIQQAVVEEIILPVIDNQYKTTNIVYHINPSGSFIVGGPQADTGLTGRKIIVDTYGGSCPHGGGAFSGKDPSKVDRSGAYMARYLAKNIVAAGLAEKCLIQLAYAIGRAEPVSLMIDFSRTGQLPESKVQEFIVKNIDLTPNGIIKQLKLKRPVYKASSTYGHFGRRFVGATWEETDQSIFKGL